MSRCPIPVVVGGDPFKVFLIGMPLGLKKTMLPMVFRRMNNDSSYAGAWRNKTHPVACRQGGPLKKNGMVGIFFFPWDDGAPWPVCEQQRANAMQRRQNELNRGNARIVVAAACTRPRRPSGRGPLGRATFRAPRMLWCLRWVSSKVHFTPAVSGPKTIVQCTGFQRTMLSTYCYKRTVSFCTVVWCNSGRRSAPYRSATPRPHRT